MKYLSILYKLIFYILKSSFYQQTTGLEDEDEISEEEDIIEIEETYDDYVPCKVQLGCKHPDLIVQSISLASIDPPDVWYKLSLPEEIINSEALSDLQLEAIIYSCQLHERILPDGSRAGFLIGDGPGVGKGRTLAGVIFENYLQGRKKSIWISASSDLTYDVVRDLRDIGAKHIAVHALNKMYEDISAGVNGLIKEGVVFSIYSTLSDKSGEKRNLHHLVEWCGKDFDGVIVFDECPRDGNTCEAVVQLQNELPKARIIYTSVNGASNPRKMGYMIRLGLWGQGTAFKGCIIPSSGYYETANQ